MAKVSVSNTEVATGKYVGKNGTRSNAEPDGVRYVSKCPFGIYFTCDLQQSKRRGTAFEKLQLIRNYRQQVMLIAQAYPTLSGRCANLIKNLLLAEVELQSYQTSDIVADRLKYRQEIKDNISSLKEAIRAKYGNCAF